MFRFGVVAVVTGIIPLRFISWLAIDVGRDPPVKLFTVHNSGIFPAMSAVMGGMIESSKADLATLHVPHLYITGGSEGVAQPNARDDFKTINTMPGFVANRPGAGHMGMAFDPNA